MLMQSREDRAAVHFGGAKQIIDAIMSDIFAQRTSRFHLHRFHRHCLGIDFSPAAIASCIARPLPRRISPRCRQETPMLMAAFH